METPILPRKEEEGLRALLKPLKTQEILEASLEQPQEKPQTTLQLQHLPYEDTPIAIQCTEIQG